MRGNECSYMTSYLLSNVTMRLGSTVLHIQLFTKYLDLDLTFHGHPRSKVMRGNESLHMTSYLLSTVTTLLGSPILKIQLFENILTLI